MYTRLSVVRQPELVALLTVGSAAQPKEDVLQLGEAGNKQLVALKDEGEKGLSAFFEKNKTAAMSVLGPNGMPPLPPSRHPQGKRYEMLKDQTYGSQYVSNPDVAMPKNRAHADDNHSYPCRTFE